MKRNLDLPMLDLFGKPYKENEKLGDIILTALTALRPQDDTLTGNERNELFKLAIKVSKMGVIDLTPEELTALKARVGITLFPMVVGKVWEMLDADFIDPALPSIPSTLTP